MAINGQMNALIYRTYSHFMGLNGKELQQYINK